MEPLVWEEMMLFLEPENGPKMQVEHVTRILPMYEMYEFEWGKELCNAAIARYFETSSAWGTIELPETIQVMHLANEYKLEALNKNIVAKLRKVLKIRHNLVQLSQADVANLLPLLPQYDMLLWRKLYAFLGGHEPTVPGLSFLVNNLSNPMLAQVFYLGIQLSFVSFDTNHLVSLPTQNVFTVEEVTPVVERLVEIVRSRNLSNMLGICLGDIATLIELFPKFAFLFKDFHKYLGPKYMEQDNIVETLSNALFPQVLVHKIHLCKIRMHIAANLKCIALTVCETPHEDATKNYEGTSEDTFTAVRYRVQRCDDSTWQLQRVQEDGVFFAYQKAEANPLSRHPPCSGWKDRDGHLTAMRVFSTFARRSDAERLQATV